MAAEFWVVAEHWKGQVSPITYEALALGREVADQLGASLRAILLGHNARELSGTLGSADSVIYANHPLLSEVLAETYAESLVQLLKERKPKGIIFPLTNVSLGAATLLGARLGLPVVNFCTDIQFVEGRLLGRCILYGGKIESRVTAGVEPIIFGLWPGARPAEKGFSDRRPPIEEFALSLSEPAIHLKKYIEPETGDVDITQQEVLVAVGRGIQSQENLQLAENLAKQFRGAVCASRPVIDQGWLPLSRQVGKSGASVKPKLYLALGISGAPEHTEGMKSASLIVAVNTDSSAPIFNMAHYGIVGDVLEFAPALSKAIEKKKEVGSHV